MTAADKKLKILEPEPQFNDSKSGERQQLAVEKWLWRDDDLWFSCNQTCYVLGRSGHFISIPNDRSKNGSYARLLPRHANDVGAFVRIPRPNLKTDCWMIVVMLDMCALEPTATSTWYNETNSVENVQYLIDRFISAAMATT